LCALTSPFCCPACFRFETDIACEHILIFNNVQAKQVSFLPYGNRCSHVSFSFLSHYAYPISLYKSMPQFNSPYCMFSILILLVMAFGDFICNINQFRVPKTYKHKLCRDISTQNNRIKICLKIFELVWCS